MIDGTRILAFLEQELGVDTAQIDESTPLFSSGLVDSFALVSLLGFLEDEARIRVRPLDVTLENMDTVARLVSYVARCREGGVG